MLHPQVFLQARIKDIILGSTTGLLISKLENFAERLIKSCNE